jgi:hypothetical protein
MLDLTLKIKTTNVPVSLPHKSRYIETEELPKYLSVSMVGTGELSLINIGAQQPSPDHTKYPWLKLSATGTPVGWYVYVGGAWVSVPVGP